MLFYANQEKEVWLCKSIESAKQICSHCRNVPSMDRFDLTETLIGWEEITLFRLLITYTDHHPNARTLS